jgi:RNA polymerase sigma-70 factor (ECF subfamily)
LRLFRYQSAFSTWLYAVVRSVFLDSVRSRRARERSLEEPLKAGRAGEVPGGDRPDEGLDREEERRRLWRLLREVPVEFRSALVLFEIEGCTYDEVAAIEGVPVGTVKSRLARGRARLRALLGEAAEDEAESEADGTSRAAPSSKTSEGSS